MAIVQAGTQHGTPIAAYRSDFTRGGEHAAKAPPGGVPFRPTHCTAKTKDGHACKARPVKNTTLCIGHTRSQSAE